MDWAKTTARGDEKHLSFEIWCDLYKRFYIMIIKSVLHFQGANELNNESVGEVLQIQKIIVQSYTVKVVC